jgi:alpha/beta superfamily hydrolase
MVHMIRHLKGPAGRLEALVDEPTRCTASALGADEESAEAPSALQPRAAVVLAHPHPLYGGTMHTKAVFQAAKAFCRIGCAVLRFNFRGAGASEGAFDNGPGERADFRGALDAASRRYPGTELWAAGMSFGAWVALTAGAEDDRVSALLGIAPPISMYDFDAVRRSTKPKFFIQGERDEVCPLKTMREFYAQLSEPKELVVIDAADHLFDGHVSEVGEAIEDLFGDFTARPRHG